MMTETEAVRVLDGLRKALRALKPMDAIQATNALLNPGPAMTSGFRRTGEFGSALTILRSAFDEMDRMGIQFPSK
jgi:hypothetical protein